AASYVYRTADGGQTWSPVRRLPHSGSAVFLSDVRWVIQDKDRFDVTDDGGLTFAAASAAVPTGWHVWPPLVAARGVGVPGLERPPRRGRWADSQRFRPGRLGPC